MQKTMVSLLPCGMVTPFRNAMEAFLAIHKAEIDRESIALEGNVNHEKTYYKQIMESNDPDEIPDILIGSDISEVFHRNFREKFVDKGLFRAYFPNGQNAGFQGNGYYDPCENFTMISCNLLVIVVDKQRLGTRPVPKSWQDLLHPQYHKTIAIRGDKDFYCNGVLLPIAQRYGIQAMTSLAQNVTKGMHPAEMAKSAGTVKQDEPAIFVMPTFFAERIVHKSSVEIIWPEEGAIPSPVFMLVKKDVPKQHPMLFNYLTSLDLAKVFTNNNFPFSHQDSENIIAERKLFWIGWKFLTVSDVGEYKQAIQNAFRNAL